MSDKLVKQLYIDKDNPKQIYPYQFMENIFDADTKENLYTYLSRFGCINVGYAADTASARRMVHPMFRLPDMILCYHVDSKDINIEQYIGNKEDAGTEAKWILDDNWRVITGTGSILDGSLTLDKFSDEVKDLIGGNPNLNIINYPDGEDLTQYDVCGSDAKYAINVLKFADKDYKPDVFSGAGRKFLRKNIVEVDRDDKKVPVNLLTQEMVDKSHTIYMVQYDYDLNGQTVTLKEGCTLDFRGGSISNGTIVCNGTDIKGMNTLMIEDSPYGNATYSGTFAVGLVMYLATGLSVYLPTGWAAINVTGQGGE